MFSSKTGRYIVLTTTDSIEAENLRDYGPTMAEMLASGDSDDEQDGEEEENPTLGPALKTAGRGTSTE